VRRLRRFTIGVDLPDSAIERTTPLLWIGVGHASFPRVAQDATPRDADQLEVVISRVARAATPSPSSPASSTARCASGRPRTTTPSRCCTCHLVLRGVASIEATIDGEVVRVGVPLTVSLQPRALRVVAPAERWREALTSGFVRDTFRPVTDGHEVHPGPCPPRLSLGRKRA
jgi:hypothetical protein